MYDWVYFHPWFWVRNPSPNGGRIRAQSQVLWKPRIRRRSYNTPIIYIIVHVDIIIYIGVDCPFVFKRVACEIHMFVGDIMLYLYLNAYSELQFQGPECKPWRLGPHWQRQDFNLQLVSENRRCSGPKVASYHFGALVVDIPSDSGKHTKSYWKWP